MTWNLKVDELDRYQLLALVDRMAAQIETRKDRLATIVPHALAYRKRLIWLDGYGWATDDRVTSPRTLTDADRDFVRALLATTTFELSDAPHGFVSPKQSNCRITPRQLAKLIGAALCALPDDFPFCNEACQERAP